MAAEYPCDVCQQTTADFMVTMIRNGDTVAVGVECIKKWATEVDKVYKAAAKAEQTAEKAAQEGPSPAEQAWDAEHQEGRPDGAQEATELAEAVSGQDSQAAPDAGE